MIMFIIMLLLLIPLILFIKRIIFRAIKHYISKYHQDYEKILRKYSIYRYLLHSILSLYFIFWGNLFHNSEFATYLFIMVKNAIIICYTSISMTLLVLAVIDSVAEIYQNKTSASTKLTPISLYIQILKICIASIAIIITISKLLNISLGTFLTSLGAAAALLTFLFKDSVLGLVASLQLTFEDIIRIGDWVTINQYNVEGTVEKITISVIRIRNFDQTIATIPTANLLTTNITNWRGVTESGARRIQRALCIDMATIEFCSSTELEAIKNSNLLPSSVIEKIKLEDNNITNIKLFRLYIQEYLKNNPLIYQQGFPFLIRQLAPTVNGLPIELYIFTTKTGSTEFEEVQADIFDHLMAILPQFKLKIFQNASGI